MSFAAVSGQQLPQLVSGSKSSGWWGIFLLMLIESAVFVGLISSYFYLFANAPVWPPQGTPLPSFGIPIVYSVILLVSGATAWIGNRALAGGEVGKMRLWRTIGMVLLVAYLVLKGYEYFNLPYQWDDSAHASILWLISGFHSGHVLTVLLKEIVIQLLAWKGFFTQERKGAVEGATMYWVFVALWWVPLFATVYLFPNFV